MFDKKYTGVLNVEEKNLRQHQERIELKRTEEINLPPISIFVVEDEFVEEAVFLNEWSPEFQNQSRHNEIDLREFDGNNFELRVVI